MILTGDILKHFRKNRNLTQSEVAKGIISRQAYSKFERNLSEPTHEVFKELLKRLNYDFSDFINESNKQSTESHYYQLLLKGLDNSLTAKEAEQLYTYANKHKKKNSHIMHLYGRIKGHLHPKFPLIIPEFNDEDKLLFKNYIFNLNGHFSLNDLKIMGDFIGISVPYGELTTFYDGLEEFSNSEFPYDILTYQVQINKIYNNICDIFLANNDSIRARDILQKQKKFLSSRMDLRYAFYSKINETILNYLETKNLKVLSGLLEIADMFAFVGDTQTEKAIRYQYKTYVSGTKYDPDNALTPDN